MNRSTALDTRKTNQISRRSLLEWLGGGTVLALGGALAAACSSDPSPAGADSGSAGGVDAGIPDRGGGDLSAGDGGSAGATDLQLAGDGPFSFRPGKGDGKVFSGWGERTVDPQDLTALLRGWRLRVDGLVETPKTLTFAELLGLKRTDMTVDFHCVEGWSILDVPWNGVRLTDIFSLVKPKASATHVTFHTVGDTYNESLPLGVASEARTILGYGIGGSTLPLKHGFPLRLVVPRLQGYKSAKYVYRMELDDKPVDGFWVKAGYPYSAQVPASRLRPGKY